MPQFIFYLLPDEKMKAANFYHKLIINNKIFELFEYYQELSTKYKSDKNKIMEEFIKKESSLKE